MPEGTIYTCPMHPEIRQVGPGSCPYLWHGARGRKCPRLKRVRADELTDMTRRFWWRLRFLCRRSPSDPGYEFLWPAQGTFPGQLQQLATTLHRYPSCLVGGLALFSAVLRPKNRFNMFMLIAMGLPGCCLALFARGHARAAAVLPRDHEDDGGRRRLL